MKKLLLTVLCLIFTSLSVNAATTVVRYNGAGVPVSVSHGWHAPVTMRQAEAGHGYGSRSYGHNYRPYAYRSSYSYPRYARPARPCGCNRARMASQSRGINYTNPSSSRVSTTTQMSRLNKNYTIRPRRSYVENGVRYYN